jgi:integrase
MRECLSLKPKRKRGGVRMVQAYIRLKWLTGMRRGDMLRLQPSRDFQHDGIHVQPNKTANTSGKRTIYAWSDELRAVVAEALAARPGDISPELFCNRKGECYLDEEIGRASGFETVWGDFMNRVMAETKITHRFHGYDIRAKTASDADDAEHARTAVALGHPNNYACVSPKGRGRRTA